MKSVKSMREIEFDDKYVIWLNYESNRLLNTCIFIQRNAYIIKRHVWHFGLSYLPPNPDIGWKN